MSDLRICRPDDTHELDHYWDTENGKPVDVSYTVTYTPECLCPKHSQKSVSRKIKNRARNESN